MQKKKSCRRQRRARLRLDVWLEKGASKRRGYAGRAAPSGRGFPGAGTRNQVSSAKSVASALAVPSVVEGTSSALAFSAVPSVVEGSSSPLACSSFGINQAG